MLIMGEVIEERHVKLLNEYMKNKVDLIGIKAVSYTHLDVYKRQVQNVVRQFGPYPSRALEI